MNGTEEVMETLAGKQFECFSDGKGHIIAIKNKNILEIEVGKRVFLNSKEVGTLNDAMLLCSQLEKRLQK